MATVDAARDDEPILSRLQRLDIMMGYLEEVVRGSNKSAKSSCPSTPSSGTMASEGGNFSSVTSSPKSLEKRCRPMDAVTMEAQVKGTLVDRLLLLENRVLKLSMQIEREMEGKANMEREENRPTQNRKKSLKRFVKSCVEGKSKDY